MSEYNKMLYKVFRQVSDGWKYVGTFNSMYEAVKYMRENYPRVKFDIEMHGSDD